MSEPMKEKFLQSHWTAYQMTEWDPPHCSIEEFSLLHAIGCFDAMSSFCVVECYPFTIEYLLCFHLTIELKQATQKKIETLNKQIASRKQEKSKKKSKNAPLPPLDDPLEGLGNVAGITSKELLKFSRVSCKICLDPELEVLFSSAQLPLWFKTCIMKCFGIDEDEGDLRLMGSFKGDPRHYGQFKLQRGTDVDRIASSQALLEHEYVEALTIREAYFGDCTTIGPVTRSLGATPDNFPRLTTTNVYLKNVPLRFPDKRYVSLDEEREKEIKAKLADKRVSEMKLQFSTPSLMHLYYNASLEQALSISGLMEPSVDAIKALAQEDTSEVQETALIPMKKLNIEGAVMQAPPFLQRIRASGLFNPVQEYKK